MDRLKDFRNLKGYAEYLLTNKLDDLAWDSAELAKEYNINPMPHLTPAELHVFLCSNFRELLTDIIDKDPIAGSASRLNKVSTASGNKKHEHSHIKPAYAVRKIVMSRYIKEYTTDKTAQREILQELDTLLHIIEKLALQIL